MDELEIDRLRLSFGGMTVLNGISMSLQRGELLALIGPNGAGKTSVFNCISGIYRPQAGAIRFRGTDLAGMRPHEIAKLGIGRTFQHGEVFSQMTVLENLMAGRHVRIATNPLSEMLRLPSVSREERRHRQFVDGLIDLVELRRHRDTLVGELPFGVQKIIGFARALASEPSLLLLDEPSAGLTGAEREDLAYFILKTKDRLGIGMVWIEHDMQMVADLADRVHVLDYGCSLADGPPDQVLNDERVVKAYLGAAA